MTPTWVAIVVMFAGAAIGLFCGALAAAAGRADAAREMLESYLTLTDPATEALIRSVAVATVELVAEDYRNQTSMMMACRENIADRILEATQGAARDFGDAA